MGNEQPSAPKPKALNPSELQTYIMVTQVKLNQGRNKKIALIKKKEEEIKKHLSENNLDIAKAKMEGLMREEDFITVYDILGPLCEILKEKVTYIMTSKECPADLRASLDTLIYSSTRLEIEELHFIREFIKHKFSNIYVDKANSNVDKLVNFNVVEKLTVRPVPEAELICRLKAICERENIQFSFPQLVNPLVIIDPNANRIGNTVVIPSMPQISNPGNFNPYTNNNNNFPPNNFDPNNVPAGYAIPFSNTFPQQQMQGNVSYPAQYPMNNFPNMPTNNNMQPYPQMPFNPQNMNNPNYNPYESSGVSFNSIPNNFSNNIPPNNQFPNNNNSNQHPINPMGNVSNFPNTNNNLNNSGNSGFASMPNANIGFPQQGKSDTVPMMSGGFAPMGNVSTGQPNINSNSVGAFPSVNNPNFSNVNDLDFPASKK